VIGRCFQILGTRTEPEWRSQSAVVITPAVEELDWDSFASAKIMIERGEQAANAAMPAIRQLLEPGVAVRKVQAAVRLADA